MTERKLHQRRLDLEETLKQVIRGACRELKPIDSTDASIVQLTIVAIENDMAIFWSEELKRPLFIIANCFCDNSDDEHPNIEMSLTSSHHEIAVCLRDVSVVEALKNYLSLPALEEILEIKRQITEARQAISDIQTEAKDRQTYDRLQKKYGHQLWVGSEQTEADRTRTLSPEPPKT
jgi:hypothetical protein